MYSIHRGSGENLRGSILARRRIKLAECQSCHGCAVGASAGVYGMTGP